MNRPGDAMEWEVQKQSQLEIPGEPIPLEILFEDKPLLVLNKPAGPGAHPAPGHWSGTLVNALLHHLRTEGAGGFARVGGPVRPGRLPRRGGGTCGGAGVPTSAAWGSGVSRQIEEAFSRQGS